MRNIEKLNNLFKINLKPEITVICILSFFPIFFFYLSIFRFTVNIPFQDDYAILDFTNKFFSSDLPNKIHLFFLQHNEHRISFCRLLGLLLYYLTGKIDFKFLNFIGDISLVGLLILFLIPTVFSKNKAISPRLIIPPIFILFQPQYYATFVISEAATSTLPVIFFAFLSLYLLTKTSIKFFLLSLLFAIFATFTNGNGMFVFLIGIFSLIVQKQYKKIMPWAFIGITCIWFYFFGYIKPAYHPSIMASIFVHPIETVKYFFYSLGAGSLNFILVETKFTHRLPILIGVLFSLYFLYLLKIKFYKKNLVIFSFLWFLFISSVALSLCRSGFGNYYCLGSKYSLISALCIIAFYFSTIEILSQRVIRNIFPILLIVAIVFNLLSYDKHYNKLASHKAALINAFIHNDFEFMSLWPNYAKFVMSTAIAKGYYSPPDVLTKRY